MADYWWIGWVITLVTFLSGIWFTRAFKKKDRLCSFFDLYADSVRDLEDDALSYWIKRDKNIHMYQLIIKLRRLSALSAKIRKLNKRYAPPSSKDFIAFKQAITLYDNHSDVPLSVDSERAKSIMHLSGVLQSHYPDLL